MIAAILLALAGTAEREARPQADRLRADVEFLASDELEGRNLGYPGNRRAAEWIRDRFQEGGVDPAFGDSYFQEFTARRQQGANVVGIVRGRREEVVFVGAHFDHVGRQGQADPGREGGPVGGDDIWNGADDNASGTSVMLEVARVVAARRQRPRRTIVFAAFNGEEGGLLGSTYYSQHPLVPLERHDAVINLDMLGRNPERPVQIDGVGTSAGGVFRSLLTAAAEHAELEINPLTLGDILDANSDHWPFFSHQVPTISFFTGYHDDYHRATDHVDLLAYDRMEKIAAVIVEVVEALADREDAVRWGPLGLRQGEALDEAARRQLGLPDGCGAVRIRAFVPDTVLARAGAQRGDVLVAWDGDPIAAEDAVGDVERRGEAAAAGSRARLTVVRGNATVDLDARW